jgi:hypothetical protein
MSSSLRRWYTWLLLAYPPAYRAERGEEILTALLDEAEPGQRFPSLHQAVALLLGGVEQRAKAAAAAGPSRLWFDGLHLGVLLLVLVNLADAAPMRWVPAWIVLSALTALATLRAWSGLALAAATLGALQVSRPLLPGSGWLGQVVPFYGPGYGNWSMIARWAVPVVGLVVLIVLARAPGVRPRPRSPLWLLLPAAVFGVSLMPLHGTQAWRVVQAGLVLIAVAAALLVAIRALEPRPAIALGVFLAPGLALVADRGYWASTLMVGAWTVAMIALVVLTAAARRAVARRSPGS